MSSLQAEANLSTEVVAEPTTEKQSTSPKAPDKPRIATSSSFLLPPHPISTSRYHRQLLVPSISVQGQLAISRTKILLIGLGGLGSPAALYLATMGVHTLGLIDADTVSESNLHRQILHTEARVGQTKVRSAIECLRARNGEVRYLGYESTFNARNGVGVVEGSVVADFQPGNALRGKRSSSGIEGGYDIVLDCSDNPATRYLISDVCVATGTVLVSGAAQRAEGQLMRLCYAPPPAASVSRSAPDAPCDQKSQPERTTGRRSPCYRCVFPRAPPPESVAGCDEIGIIGPVVGVVGTLMAMEALKIILERAAATSTSSEGASRVDGREHSNAGVSQQSEQQAYKPSLLLYNPLSPDPRGIFRTVGLRPHARKECFACGDEEELSRLGMGAKITRERIQSGRFDYEAWCGRVEDIRVLESGQRVSVDELAKRLGEDGRKGMVVVDVRERVEFEVGAKIRGARHVPISDILRVEKGDGKGVSSLLGVDGVAGEKEVVFVCQKGNDSQIAAQKLMEEGEAGRWKWIGDVEGGFQALQRYHE